LGYQGHFAQDRQHALHAFNPLWRNAATSWVALMTSSDCYDDTRQRCQVTCCPPFILTTAHYHWQRHDRVTREWNKTTYALRNVVVRSAPSCFRICANSTRICIEPSPRCIHAAMHH
jgi:hypothetical protein